MMQTNPPKEQDRVADLFDTFEKYGYAMFPQQREIYGHISQKMHPGSVVEFGCGNGLGSIVLTTAYTYYGYMEDDFIATDVSLRNIEFARCLYPHLNFTVWDVQKPWPKQVDTVVCVECLEHVADPQAALSTMIRAAKREVWISTPNGYGKDRPPSNPYHVQEYTVDEMLDMIFDVDSDVDVTIHAWDDFRVLPNVTDVDPLVYHITKGQ